jgi:hypothetical protein
MLKYVVPAAIASLVAITSASAAPVSGPAQAKASNESGIVKVQHHTLRHRYIAGRKYRSAPRGWHRYDRRPGDWRTRGCIIVGPIWWCP